LINDSTRKLHFGKWLSLMLLFLLDVFGVAVGSSSSSDVVDDHVIFVHYHDIWHWHDIRWNCMK